MAGFVDVRARRKVVIEFITAERCISVEIHRHLTSVFVEDARDGSSESMPVVLREVKDPTAAGQLRQRQRRPETRLIC
jgi:hypothetical protein